MANPERLLAQLADGEYYSGEHLGALLGVSRAAVWKQVKRLQNLGAEILSVKGKGYCIAGGLDLLDADLIRKHLQEVEICKKVLVNLQLQLDSTNQYLIRKSVAGESVHRQVCLAESQSAGRGRRGRQWHSPFANNIYLSMGWRIQEGVNTVGGLSLAVGLIVRNVIAELGIAELSLKWPNDLQFEEKKVGGVLIEISGEATGACDLVIGLGLNVKMPRSLAQEIDQAWTDLQSVTQSMLPSRSKIASQIIVSLTQLLAHYESRGFAAYVQPWEKACAQIGEKVVLQSGQKQITGIMRGISHNGAIKLEVAGRIEEFVGGEISLRGV